MSNMPVRLTSRPEFRPRSHYLKSKAWHVAATPPLRDRDGLTVRGSWAGSLAKVTEFKFGERHPLTK